MEFKQTQLDNGLTIIAEVNQYAKSLALGFFVRTGARDETPEIAGVSHFLEHMMFKGTAQLSALEVNLEFDQMGAKYNAFTSEENTVYYAAVLPEYQERIVALWADLMRPALREEDFGTEKTVICEEIAMYQDNPAFDVSDRCRRLHFGDHPCGNSVLGTVNSIENLRVGQMREYFQRRYAPDNMIVACVGHLDWSGLVQQINQLCGHWSANQARRSVWDYRGTNQVRQIANNKVIREHIVLMAAAPSAQAPQRYAASVLASVIGDDVGSRFYWALIDTALADEAELDYDPMDGTGLYNAYISCDPVQTEKIIGIVKNCLSQIHRQGVTDKELQAGKNKIASMATLHGELPMGRMVPLGFNWVYRRQYRPLAEEIAAIQAVSDLDIDKLLQEYPLDNFSMLTMGPEK